MILLDPDLSPSGRRPGDRDADPVAAKRAIKRGTAIAQPHSKRRQTGVPSARSLARFLARARAAVKLRGQASVLLTTDAKIRRLNRTFRGKDKATDVLSFPASGQISSVIAGDLAISVPTARRQAGGQGHSLVVEIKVLILHGLLHLAGYDHEIDDGRMARREQRLRARLGLPLGLIERASDQPAGSPSNTRRNGARGTRTRRETRS